MMIAQIFGITKTRQLNKFFECLFCKIKYYFNMAEKETRVFLPAGGDLNNYAIQVTLFG